MRETEFMLLQDLEREHADFVKQLERLHQLVGLLEPAAHRPAYLGSLGALLTTFPPAVRQHADVEEARLYPLMEGDLPASLDANLLSTLRSEHRTVDALLSELSDRWTQVESGMVDAVPGLVKAAQSLRGTLSAHLQRENLLVFPRLRRAWKG